MMGSLMGRMLVVWRVDCLGKTTGVSWGLIRDSSMDLSKETTLVTSKEIRSAIVMDANWESTRDVPMDSLMELALAM